jgi:hypothetical protein
MGDGITNLRFSFGVATKESNADCMLKRRLRRRSGNLKGWSVVLFFKKAQNLLA